MAGIRLFQPAAVEAMFVTCCVLHNILLQVDRLDKPWTKGKAWVDAEKYADVLAAVSEDAALLNVDWTNHGAGRGMHVSLEGNADPISHEVQVQTETNYFTFRSKLVNHLSYIYSIGQLKWPSQK